MVVSRRNVNKNDVLAFTRENKEKFNNVVENEIKDLNSGKVSFGMKAEFSIIRNNKRQTMEHYFQENQPNVFNKNDQAKIKIEFYNFVETMKGEIEAWSARGSGWVLERIMVAYVNVARYQPLRGGTYLDVPPKLKNKKAVINVRNRDEECLKWALRAALFPCGARKNPQRPGSYSVADGINYTGIDFPTPVRQIDKLEAQNRNLAINVFGWENNCVIVHRLSKKEAKVPRINLMLIEKGEKQHYCYVKRVSALLFDQSKHQHAKHFCMMCLTGFTREDILKKHKEYCSGLNGRPTRIEMPEKGKNKVIFQNHHKQMKVPFIIYLDFEALVKKMHRCERPEGANESYTEKTDQHEACGFSYIDVRSDGVASQPVVYRGKNAVGTFLREIVNEETKIREFLATPHPLVMTVKDWENHKIATECHICNQSLFRDSVLDSLPVCDHDTGRYCGQSHKMCYYAARKKIEFIGPKRERKQRDKIDFWVAKNQETCLFCGDSLMKQNYKDCVKDHCHITGKYRGAAHNSCNLKLRIKPKTDQIPVVFHSLRGYDAHHLMQAMSQLQREVKCIANNMEKYMTFSVGGLRFIDSLNFLQGSLDSLVRATPKDSLRNTAEISKGSELLFKKGIYPYEYMDSWQRFDETNLPEKKVLQQAQRRTHNR